MTYGNLCLVYYTHDYNFNYYQNLHEHNFLELNALKKFSFLKII